LSLLWNIAPQFSGNPPEIRSKFVLT